MWVSVIVEYFYVLGWKLRWWGKKVKVAEREWIRDADHVDVQTEYEMVIPKGDWSFGCICSLYICMTTYAYHAWLKHSCSCVQ